MRAWGDGHVVAGYRGGASPRCREAVAAGGYTVTAGIPVTILSAEASPAIIRYMRTRGVIAYLTKPLDFFMAGHDHGADPVLRTVLAP